MDAAALSLPEVQPVHVEQMRGVRVSSFYWNALVIIRRASTKAAPNLHRLRRLRRELEEGLSEAYRQGIAEGERLERTKKPSDQVADWARRLSGNRLLTDAQAIEWLHYEELRRDR